MLFQLLTKAQARLTYLCVRAMNVLELDLIYLYIVSIIVMIIDDNRHVKGLLRDIWLLFS